MSVSSLTNVAYKRRKDVAPTDSMPRSAGEVAAATGDASATQSTFTSALTALMAYIPTEILTAYVAVLAGLQVADQQTQAPPGAWVSFWVFLVLTPTMVWAIYAGKCRVAGKVLPTSPGKWPMWEMSAATVAFVVWAFALPNIRVCRSRVVQARLGDGRRTVGHVGARGCGSHRPTAD